MGTEIEQTARPVELVRTASDIRRQVNLIQEVMKEVMQDGEHFGKVPGCGDKPTLLQPGAQKLIMTFRLVPDPEMSLLDLGQGHREVRCKVKMYSQAGVLLGAGVGTCSTLESKYRYRTGPVELTEQPVPREYWDLRQKDPVKARALLGGAGRTTKKNDGGQWVIAIQGEKVEHDNPADYYNTVEKMAFKRALVSATLTVTAASDIFTQDIEDLPDGTVQATPAANGPHPSAPDPNLAKMEAAKAAKGAKSAKAAPADPPPAAPPPPESGAPSELDMLVEDHAEWAAWCARMSGGEDTGMRFSEVKKEMQIPRQVQVKDLPVAQRREFAQKMGLT